jgi:integrase
MSWKMRETPAGGGRSPFRILDDAGQDVGWINDFLDSLSLRALSPRTLRTYASLLLDFGRWWNSLGEAWGVPQPSLLTDYMRYQLSKQPLPSPESVNARMQLVERLYRFHFGPPDEPGDTRLRRFWYRRSQWGYGRRRLEWNRLRVKQPKTLITPLSREQVARFWASFHTCRDMALVALMVFNGLRSGETRELRVEDLSFSEAQLLVPGKGRRQRRLPLPPETLRLLDLYVRTERPATSSPYLFVSLKGPAAGQPMTPEGLRSLFRYHRQTSHVPQANPHRFRHTFASDMIRQGMSLPALMHLMGHADIETTMVYISLTPTDVWREYARAVTAKTAPPSSS